MCERFSCVCVGLFDQQLFETPDLRTGEDYMKRGQGFYGFGNKKSVYHSGTEAFRFSFEEVYHSNEEAYGTGIRFVTGDIVELIFDPKMKILTATNQTKNQTSKMKVPCDSPLVPVALLQ